VFQVGRFIGIAIDFLIVMWVMFLFSKLFMKDEKK
jgi:large-conductance mechanosensitive channel